MPLPRPLRQSSSLLMVVLIFSKKARNLDCYVKISPLRNVGN